MSKKTFAAALALGTLSVLALGGTAIAKGGHGSPFGGMGRIVENLDLTPEQQELGMALREEAKADHDAQRESRSAAFEVITVELAKESPDSAALHGLIDAQLASMSVSMHERLNGLLTLHATFTEEQRLTLVDEMELARERRESRMEEGPQGRGEGGRGGRGGR